MEKRKTDPVLTAALLKGTSLLLSTLPVTVCTLCYFPLWKTGGSLRMLSGFTALLLVLCALPLYRAVKKLLFSPGVWVMWLFAFLLFLLLSEIAEEMTVIAATGTVGNLLGALLWKLGENRQTEKRRRDDAGS